ncbi:MAG TPA: transposase [Thermodesulfobacteriota bacterium]|nr:transposase [Thermodesulfobacteriota bacterium]
MARPLRIEYENAYYHVTCRGNSGQDIFSTDGDRSKFLDLLSRSRDIYQTEILAYVLMSNHFHLFVKTPLGNLQEFMRHFNICYTSYYNWKHGRRGHLYQGRYKSFLVDSDNYLQEVSRYIHLNPIRVGLRSSITRDEKKRYLRSYPWSSYGDYLSEGRRRSFLEVEEVLAYFGGDTAKGRRDYEEFVMEGVSRKVPNPLEKGAGHGIIGTEGFIKKIRGQYVQSTLESREVPAVKRILAQVEPEKIIGVISESFKVEKEELLRKGYKGVGRGVLMEMLYRYGGMKQNEIGELLGIDYSAVSVMRKRLLELQGKNRKLLALIEKVEKRL